MLGADREPEPVLAIGFEYVMNDRKQPAGFPDTPIPLSDGTEVKIKSCIGSGKYSDAYEAELMGAGSPVAWLRLRHTWLADGDEARRYRGARETIWRLNEAELGRMDWRNLKPLDRYNIALDTISSRVVIALLDAGDYQGRPWLLQELAPPEVRIEIQAFRELDFLDVAVQFVRALKIAHDLGFALCDLGSAKLDRLHWDPAKRLLKVTDWDGAAPNADLSLIRKDIFLAGGLLYQLAGGRQLADSVDQGRSPDDSEFEFLRRKKRSEGSRAVIRRALQSPDGSGYRDSEQLLAHLEWLRDTHHQAEKGEKEHLQNRVSDARRQFPDSPEFLNTAIDLLMPLANEEERFELEQYRPTASRESEPTVQQAQQRMSMVNVNLRKALEKPEGTISWLIEAEKEADKLLREGRLSGVEREYVLFTREKIQAGKILAKPARRLDEDETWRTIEQLASELYSDAPNDLQVAALIDRLYGAGLKGITDISEVGRLRRRAQAALAADYASDDRRLEALIQVRNQAHEAASRQMNEEAINQLRPIREKLDKAVQNLSAEREYYAAALQELKKALGPNDSEIDGPALRSAEEACRKVIDLNPAHRASRLLNDLGRARRAWEGLREAKRLQSSDTLAAAEELEEVENEIGASRQPESAEAGVSELFTRLREERDACQVQINSQAGGEREIAALFQELRVAIDLSNLPRVRTLLALIKERLKAVQSPLTNEQEKLLGWLPTVEAGCQKLLEADWQGAAVEFRRAVEARKTPLAEDGLSLAEGLAGLASNDEGLAEQKWPALISLAEKRFPEAIGRVLDAVRTDCLQRAYLLTPQRAELSSFEKAHRHLQAGIRQLGADGVLVGYSRQLELAREGKEAFEAAKATSNVKALEDLIKKCKTRLDAASADPVPQALRRFYETLNTHAEGELERIRTEKRRGRKERFELLKQELARLVEHDPGENALRPSFYIRAYQDLKGEFEALGKEVETIESGSPPQFYEEIRTIVGEIEAREECWKKIDAAHQEYRAGGDWRRTFEAYQQAIDRTQFSDKALELLREHADKWQGIGDSLQSIEDAITALTRTAGQVSEYSGAGAQRTDEQDASRQRLWHRIETLWNRDLTNQVSRENDPVGRWAESAAVRAEAMTRAGALMAQVIRGLIAEMDVYLQAYGDRGEPALAESVDAAHKFMGQMRASDLWSDSDLLRAVQFSPADIDQALERTGTKMTAWQAAGQQLAGYERSLSEVKAHIKTGEVVEAETLLESVRKSVSPEVVDSLPPYLKSRVEKINAGIADRQKKLGEAKQRDQYAYWLARLKEPGLSLDDFDALVKEGETRGHFQQSEEDAGQILAGCLDRVRAAVRAKQLSEGRKWLARAVVMWKKLNPQAPQPAALKADYVEALADFAQGAANEWKNQWREDESRDLRFKKWRNQAANRARKISAQDFEEQFAPVYFHRLEVKTGHPSQVRWLVDSARDGYASCVKPKDADEVVYLSQLFRLWALEGLTDFSSKTIEKEIADWRTKVGPEFANTILKDALTEAYAGIYDRFVAVNSMITENKKEATKSDADAPTKVSQQGPAPEPRRPGTSLSDWITSLFNQVRKLFGQDAPPKKK